MESNHYKKAAVTAGLLLVIFVGSWEYFWRQRGYPLSFNDDKIIWADVRKHIYLPQEKATVFIGGSRIKFDLDIPTWEKLTGEKVIQLALVGTSPRPMLHDLANDENFRGKVIMDVTEHAFFSMDSLRNETSARDALLYYKDETPAQKLSASVDFMLESKFLFLEEGKFGLNSLSYSWKLPNRQTVVPRRLPPRWFAYFSRGRQASMTPIFLENKFYQDSIIKYWAAGAVRYKAKPIRGDTLEAYFKELKYCIDKIRSRGGKVVIVRPPSGGKFLEREHRDYPRNLYWDPLLKYTQTEGIYYTDYPETAYLICPEESHLAPSDGIIYTKSLIRVLKEEKGWDFRGPEK